MRNFWGSVESINEEVLEAVIKTMQCLAVWLKYDRLKAAENDPLITRQTKRPEGFRWDYIMARCVWREVNLQIQNMCFEFFELFILRMQRGQNYTLQFSLIIDTKIIHYPEFIWNNFISNIPISKLVEFQILDSKIGPSFTSGILNIEHHMAFKKIILNIYLQARRGDKKFMKCKYANIIKIRKARRVIRYKTAQIFDVKIN